MRVGVRTLAVLGFALVLCPARAESHDLRTLFQHPRYQNAKISWDGRYIAATMWQDDQVMLAVLDASSMEFTKAFRLDLDEHVRDFWWLGENRLLHDSVRKRGHLTTATVVGNLYAVDADGGNATLLFGPTAGKLMMHRVADLFHDAPHQIGVVTGEGFDTSRPEAWRVDVRGSPETAWTSSHFNRRDRRLLGKSPLPNGDLIIDRTGQPRLAIGTTADGQIRCRYREANAEAWHDLDDLFPRAGIMDLEALGFAPDGRLYVLRDTPEGTRGLYLLEPLERTFQPLLADPTYDLSRGDVIWSRFDERLLGVAYMGEKPRAHFFDEGDEETRVHTQLARAFPDQRVRVTSQTRDGIRSIVHVRGDRNPGAFYLYDAEEKRAAKLFDARPGLDPAEMAPLRPVRIPARDGLELPGYLTLPKSGASALPLIVLVHGGPHGYRDEFRFDPEAQLFASRGFAVLQVNYRGSGGYGARFEEAGYGQWGEAIQDDLADATRWAIREGIADPERICIYGASFGGYAAMMGAVRNPELFRCAASYAGVYDLEQIIEDTTWRYRRGRRGFARAFYERAIGTNDAELASRSPVSRAADLVRPVFLAHGREDPVVPVSQFHAMREALEKAGAQHDTLLKRGELHGFYKLENRVELYERLLAFLERHTPVPERAEAADQTSR